MNNIKRTNLPNEELKRAIELQKHTYAGNHILGPYGMDLATIEYKRCLEWFQNQAPGQAPQNIHIHIPVLLDVMAQIKLKEDTHQTELEQLARNLIADFFEFPEENFQNTSINESFELQDDTPEPKTEVDQDKLQVHVDKRIILNAIVHGGAVNCWKTIHLLAEEELNEIDPELNSLYSKLTSLSSMMMWQTPPLPDMPDDRQRAFLTAQSVKQGQNQVIFDEDEPQVAAQATCFPVLLHELIKGILDLISLYGIDQSLSADEQQYIMNQADSHWDERWYYLFGPGLWDILMENEQPNSIAIGEMMQDISTTKYSSIVTYFQNSLEDARNITEQA
jgi:hypothetical protein